MTDRVSQITVTSRDVQFLREARNPHGRVAGHNNQMALRLERPGLVQRDNRSIGGQSNFLITDEGRRVLEGLTQ